jgi:hypothetical protein
VAARVAVGADGGGGGAGGVDLATFLLQPTNNSIAAKVTRKVDTFNSIVFTLIFPFAEVSRTSCWPNHLSGQHLWSDGAMHHDDAKDRSRGLR